GDSQVLAGDLLWLRDLQHSQDGGRNSSQGSIRLKSELLAVLGDDDEWQRVRGVSGVWTASCRIDHHFGVAVIRSNQHGTTFRAHCLLDFSKATVHGSDFFHRRLDL